MALLNYYKVIARTTEAKTKSKIISSSQRCQPATGFFYKQHFYEQCQVENGKKSSKIKLGSTLRLNFCFLKIIRFLHPRYHPKIGDILKNIQKTNASVLMRLFMTTKTRLKMKNRSHIYNINGPRHGHRYTKFKI